MKPNPVPETFLSALQRAHTANMSNNPPAPKPAPTRCRNCNQPMSRYCRKCNGSYNIKTQGRTRK